jgi:hypothetical protein
MLELDRVRGTQSCFLNGKALTAISPARSYYLIPLSEIEDRNVLVLEVETSAPAVGATESDPDWGLIALVIRAIDGSAGT